MELDGSFEITALIIRNIAGNKTIKLDFVLPNAHPVGHDNRLLGVAFRSMKIECDRFGKKL